jgi:copper homeostasis protein
MGGVQPILEVIALTAADARAARDGGADRIELVTAMARDGLTPELETFERVRAATDLPVRVMLRDTDGYGRGAAAELDERAARFRRAGAREFVLGFLDARGAVDVPVLEALHGCAWTFHRAVDHAADRAAALRAIRALPGVDQVLTAGSPAGVGAGLEVLRAEAARAAGPRILAGGGLRPEHVAPLRSAGVDAFHIGSGARRGGWDAPVDAALVRRWRSLLDDQPPTDR